MGDTVEIFRALEELTGPVNYIMNGIFAAALNNDDIVLEAESVDILAQWLVANSRFQAILVAEHAALIEQAGPAARTSLWTPGHDDK
jgi:hypothetical protein